MFDTSNRNELYNINVSRQYMYYSCITSGDATTIQNNSSWFIFRTTDQGSIVKDGSNCCVKFRDGKLNNTTSSYTLDYNEGMFAFRPVMWFG